MRTGGGRRVNHICNIGRRATRLREIMLASIWGSTQLPLSARHDKTLHYYFLAVPYSYLVYCRLHTLRFNVGELGSLSIIPSQSFGRQSNALTRASVEIDRL